jgi:hypothetical protein
MLPMRVLVLTESRRHCAHRGPGYINQGGTLNTAGMLFVNRCSWAHCLAEVARLLDLPRAQLLNTQEERALDCNSHSHIAPAWSQKPVRAAAFVRMQTG